MRKTMLTLLCLLVAVAMQSQRTFAPGQVLFKMRDASPVTVQNGNGRLRTSNANINNVLTEFGVQSMKKVLPDAKPVANPRRTKAPDGKSYVYEHDLSQLYKVCMADTSEVRTLELVRRLNDMPEVEYAQPNFRYSINEPATTVGTDSCICPPQTAHPALRTNTRICPYEALRQAEEGSSKGFYDDEEGRTLMYYDGETLVDDPTTNPKYEEEGQWGLRYLKMPELWKKPVINRRRPVVAVLDSGVDMDHPDLKDNILPGCENNFPPDSYDINSIDDEKGHGTRIAGIIAATDDETGIIGANPHALIMPVRVLDKDGSGYTDEIIWGINLAAKNGADIINMGFGGPADNIQSSVDYVRNLEHALYQAIDNAYQTSIIVGSGGNNKKLDSPALNPHVLAVAAYDSYGVLASFAPDDPDGVHSGYGFFDNVYYDVTSNCELRAPGVSILSTWKDGDYNIESGSSMACAYVSGAISALLMLKDYASREELWGDLTHGSDFEEIYNITERPADLDFLGFMADTRKVLEPGKRNVDFKVHAGGSAKVIGKLRLYPVLRTVFGKASNIRVHAELDESVNKDLYQLAVADVDFGCELEPYVNEVSKNPFLLKVSPDMSGNDEIIINITATCKETGEVMESSINVRLEKTNRKAVCEPDGGYCVYNDEEKSLTFYYDDLVKERTGEVFSTEPVYDKASEQYFPQWTSLICDRVEHVIFDPSYVDARPESMELWFYMFGNLHTIDNIEYLNTSEVKNMAGTFALCTSLYSIDLSHFDTRSVTNMSNMFWYCTSLYSADLSRFNMSNVTRTDWMFNGCKQLLSVYCNEDWNSLPRLENSADMFAGCSKLMGEAGTKFDSSAPANATLARPDGGKPGYFTTKTILQDADVNVDGTVDVADIAAVISVMAGSRARFLACQSTNDGTGEGLARSEACPTTEEGLARSEACPTTRIEAAPAEQYAVYTDANATLTFYFDNRKGERKGTVYSLNGIYDIYIEEYLPEWRTDIVNKLERVVFDPSFFYARPTSMENWFYGCSQLRVFDNLEYLNSSAVTNMNGTFSFCYSLYSFNTSHIDTHAVTDMSDMFEGCSNLYSLDLSRQNMTSAVNLDYMFLGCKKLRTIYCNRDWSELPKLKSKKMFTDCNLLRGGAGTLYDGSAASDITLARPDGEQPGYFTAKPVKSNPDVNADGAVDVADIAYIISVMAGR